MTISPLRILKSLLCSLVFISCANHDSHENENEHEAEHHDAYSIEIQEYKARSFGIEYEIANPGKFHDVIKTSGLIEASAGDTYTVSARKSGIITLSSHLALGKEVNRGEAFASISSAGMQGGDVNTAAKVNLETARKEYERIKGLYEERLVTVSVFREAERAYKEAEALAGTGGVSSSVTSPANGVVEALYVKSGDYVETGAPLAIVATNSSRVLKADLPMRLSSHYPELTTAHFIPSGSNEVVKIEDLDGKKISGSAVSKAESGYLPVYFSFSGNSLSSPSGAVEVYLICGERQNVISVPKGALVEIQGNKYAYVVEEEHDGDIHLEKRLVTIGADDGERVEITQGLSQGEKVVSKGASVVRMIEVSAIAPPAHTHNH